MKVTVKVKPFLMPNFLRIDGPVGDDECGLDVGYLFPHDEEAAEFWDGCKAQWVEHVRRRRELVAKKPQQSEPASTKDNPSTECDRETGIESFAIGEVRREWSHDVRLVLLSDYEALDLCLLEATGTLRELRAQPDKLEVRWVPSSKLFDHNFDGSDWYVKVYIAPEAPAERVEQ